ncbi:MAG: polysaccharide biosynthesis tyrosine autokinase [Akkermansiaceae bacterium]|nr:polysaccharide biosynthesis tyrosine autokinase [Akkermansiaceae bacterium]
MVERNNSVQQAEAILHAQDYLQVLKSRWKEALFVFLLVFVICAVATKLMTPEYTSTSRVEIRQPNEQVDVSMSGSGVNPVALAASGQGYIPTQLEVLVSKRNLLHVVEQLKLDKEWGMSADGAAGVLRNRIKLNPVEGTNMVDIVVTHPNAQTACAVCSQLVATYMTIREDEETKRIKSVVDERRDALDDAREDLEKKSKAVQDIIFSGKYLTGWRQGSTVESIGGEQQKVNSLQQSLLALENELNRLDVHINQLKDLKDEPLLKYVENSDILSAESFASSRVRELNKQLRDLKDERSKKLDTEGYGENHLRIKGLDLQIEQTTNQLYASLTDMREAMVRQQISKQEEKKKLEAELAAAKGRARDENLERRDYEKSKADYDQALEIYNDLERKYKAEDQRYKAAKGRDKEHARDSSRDSVVVYAEPVKAGAPSTPNVKLNLIVGAVVGLISGIVVAFIYNYFDTSVKSLEDAERHLGLPVLGVIPQDAGLLALQDGNTPDAEAYRILRTNIELKRSLSAAKTFAIVSANAGEGKTTTLSNLAYVYASAGFSTLMVDADLRRPRLARYAEMEDSFGLSNYLTSDIPLKEAVFKTSVPNLYLMPSGPQPMDPSGVLGSYRMEQLLSETARRFDVVLFDSPPVLGVSDASLLVSKMDACLIVLQPRKMPLKALLRTKSIINNVGGKIMGIVMNNVDISSDTQYQYYTTYYSYYSNDNSRVEPVPAKQSASAPVVPQKKANKSETPSSDRRISASNDEDLY